MDTATNPVHSPWLAGSEDVLGAPLSADIDVDVAVIGGGIVGVSVAHHLAAAGVDVVLLEARTIAGGVTGNSTAKLTALHGLIYRQLAADHGAGPAQAYAELSLSGLDQVLALAQRYGIESRLSRRPALTYAERPGNRGQVEEEVTAARAAGLDAEYTEETDLPFAVAAAVRVDDQAQFDPVAWTRGLAAAAVRHGASIHEHTRATSVSTRGPRPSVATDAGGRVHADRVVVATHMPFLDRGLHFARLRPERSYAVAGPSDRAALQGMYLSVEKPTRSIRAFHDRDGAEHVIVGGEGHKIGHSSPGEHYLSLESDLVGWFGVERIDYRWSAHDLISADGLPFVGRLAPFGSETLLTACGFNKWGLAAGVGAAAALRDLVLGHPSPLCEVFDPTRAKLRSSLPKLVKENADVGRRFAADRLKRAPLGDLAPGEGKIVGSGLSQHAVHRDESGVVHRLSARCTHLGCIVAWNQAERTWDCPCHGSRFAATGEVVQGPAVAPLDRRDG